MDLDPRRSQAEREAARGAISGRGAMVLLAGGVVLLFAGLFLYFWIRYMP